MVSNIAYIGRRSRKYQSSSIPKVYCPESWTNEILCHLRSSGHSQVSLLRARGNGRHAEVSRNVVFTPHSLRVKYQASEGWSWTLLYILTQGTMIIDFLSVRNLELVQNLQNPKSSQCLYGVLDHCHTPMGKRLLRASILQPSCGILWYGRIWYRQQYYSREVRCCAGDSSDRGYVSQRR